MEIEKRDRRTKYVDRRLESRVIGRWLLREAGFLFSGRVIAMNIFYKIILGLLGALAGLILFFFLFVQFLIFADGQFVVTNDTNEDIEFLFFSYDSHETDLGRVSDLVYLERGETVSFWRSGVTCFKAVDSDGALYLGSISRNGHDPLLISDALGRDSCPLDITQWNEGDRWYCEASKSGFESCVKENEQI